ncbi:MAG: HD-GYP domain-containing protein [Sporomusaceae bacterium]|nr:HD-GYP domain-containing protein [Sporomusaceae bacterium]
MIINIGDREKKFYFPSSILQADIHEVVDAFTTAIDAKHPYTRGHSDRVADLALAIARRAGFSENFQHFVHIAGHLHDLGKIGVPDAILLKPGALTKEEFDQIKAHATIGYDILCKVKSWEAIADAVRHHHERWDGGGYPDGLAGKAIPLVSRIITVADSYDAMTSSRAYRSSLNRKEALAEICRHSGAQFDPYIVKVFLQLPAAVVPEKQVEE